MTVGLSAICAVAAGLLFWLNGGRPPRLVILLAVAASVGLAGTVVGSTSRSAVTTVQARLGQTAAIGATAAGIIIGGSLLFIVVLHFAGKTVSLLTLVASLLLPVATALIPGEIGLAAQSLLGGVANATSSILNTLFGLGGA